LSAPLSLRIPAWLWRLWWLLPMVLLGLVFPSPSARLMFVVQQQQLLWRLEWLAFLIVAISTALFLQQRLGRWRCIMGLAVVTFLLAASAQWLRQHRLVLDLPAGWSLLAVALFVLITFIPTPRSKPPA
jgi:hypothetical protein